MHTKSSTKVQNLWRCSCMDKHLRGFAVKDAKTLEEINAPNDHYLLPHYFRCGSMQWASQIDRPTRARAHVTHFTHVC